MSFGDPFLALPDLFPARASGEPWGNETVAIRIAGNAYRCKGLSVEQADGLRARFGSLCSPAADSGESAILIHIFRASDADFIDDGRVWEFDFDLDYAPSAVSVAGFHFMGRLDWLPRLTAALWTCENAKLVSHAILENLLRVVVAYDLFEQGGLLLHSAALADKSVADVFFGPSGAGKTTISRLGLAAGRQVLSDDMNALRVDGSNLFVEKVPFAGDLGQTPHSIEGKFAVRNLCRLQKGAAPALRRPTRAAAVAALLECAPFVNRNPHRYVELVEKLQAIEERLPVQVLTFAPDDSVWKFLDR
jgi:hypothetical protein